MEVGLNLGPSDYFEREAKKSYSGMRSSQYANTGMSPLKIPSFLGASFQNFRRLQSWSELPYPGPFKGEPELPHGAQMLHLRMCARLLLSVGVQGALPKPNPF